MTQRKHLILILSIFLLCFSFSAFANLDNKSTNSNQNKIHQFDLNYERFYFLYQRKQNKLTINGFMSGISGSYTFRPTDQQIFRIPFLDFYRFEGLYSYGKPDYRHVATGQPDTSKAFLTESRALFGKDLNLFTTNTLTSFIGYGYRYFKSDTAGPPIYGYLSKSYYYYIPMGIELTTRPFNKWKFTYSAEYDYFLKGLLKNYYSQTQVPILFDFKSEDLNIKQNKGFGLRGSIRVAKEYRFINFFLEPYIRYWCIKDSRIEYGLTENTPELGNQVKNNKTTEFGLKVGIEF